MDLTGMRREENLRNLKTTVLCRKRGIWSQPEIDRLVSGLVTEVSQHPEYPEYLIIFGHYTKEQVLKTILGGVAFTTRSVTGTDSKELPFYPGFI